MSLIKRLGNIGGYAGFGSGRRRISADSAGGFEVSSRVSGKGGGRADPIVLSGFVEIDDYLSQLEDSVQKKALRPATRAAAKYTRELAQSYAPEKTGQLIAAIKVRAARRVRAHWGKHRVATQVTVGQGLFIGDEYYAGFMEFGTRERQHKSGKRTGRVPGGFDFLRRALWAFPSIKRAIFENALVDWVAKQKGAAN